MRINRARHVPPRQASCPATVNVRRAPSRTIAADEFLKRWTSNVRTFIAHVHAIDNGIYQTHTADTHTISFFVEPQRVKETYDYGGEMAAIEQASERVFHHFDAELHRVQVAFEAQLRDNEHLVGVDPPGSEVNYFVHVRAKGLEGVEVAFFWITITLAMKEIEEGILEGLEKQAWASLAETFGLA